MFPAYNLLEQKLVEIGRTAKELNISLSIHPDQFVVIGSESDDVCAKSVAELNFHSWVLDTMRMPQDHTCPINIHPSLSKFSSPEKFIDKLVINFFQCDIGVRNRLVFENEHHGFWNCNNLYEYFHNYMKHTYMFHFPLTLDNLHDDCNPSFAPDGNRIPYNKLFIKFYQTWPVTPVFHWSEGIDKTFKHANTVTVPPPELGLDVIYEVEVKHKDKGFIHLLSK
jgi:UV DNA damage endonuclease